MSFYDLARIEEDQLDPSIRLAFTGLLTLVLALMLSTGLIAVTIGGFHANEWPKSVEDALLLGALAGLGEKALPANIMKHAGSLMMGKEPEKKS
jgi:predicted membrane protein